jgi:hypothetical protein
MYGRALMERALEGGFNFLDAELATETCTVTCRFQEHMQMMPLAMHILIAQAILIMR